eukprot:scaffold30979_cov86-Cyclotella_meneghiniana.AAC.4
MVPIIRWFPSFDGFHHLDGSWLSSYDGSYHSHHMMASIIHPSLDGIIRWFPSFDGFHHLDGSWLSSYDGSYHLIALII